MSVDTKKPSEENLFSQLDVLMNETYGIVPKVLLKADFFSPIESLLKVINRFYPQQLEDKFQEFTPIVKKYSQQGFNLNYALCYLKGFEILIRYNLIHHDFEGLNYLLSNFSKPNLIINESPKNILNLFCLLINQEKKTIFNFTYTTKAHDEFPFYLKESLELFLNKNIPANKIKSYILPILPKENLDKLELFILWYPEMVKNMRNTSSSTDNQDTYLGREEFKPMIVNFLEHLILNSSNTPEKEAYYKSQLTSSTFSGIGDYVNAVFEKKALINLPDLMPDPIEPIKIKPKNIL